MHDGRNRSDPLAGVLLALSVVLMLSALGFRIWASNETYRFTGPTHIAAGQGNVFLHAAGDIHHFSPSGQLVDVIPAARLGFLDDPIDLRVLDDGRLLIAGQVPAQIRLCEPGPWVCERLAPAAVAGIARQFKVHPLNAAGSWLLTDAEGDRLWRLDDAAIELFEVLPPGTLAGPNGIAADADGVLWIADTDHRRIVEIIALPDGRYAAGREHSAHNDLTIERRHYPMMLEWGANGRFWVVQASSFSEARADLVVYDRERGAVDVADLPDGAYPTDVAASGRAILVTDMDRFAVYQVDTVTGQSARFGDEAFNARMATIEARRASLERLGTVSLGVLVLAVAVAIGLAIRLTPSEKRAWRRLPALVVEGATTPSVNTVHWLERHRRARFFERGYERLFYVLFGLLCLFAYLVYAWSCKPSVVVDEADKALADRLGVLLFLMCLAVASFIPMVHFAAAAFRRRLGTDGQQLLLEFETGRRISIDPARIAWNDRAVLYENHTFPLQTGMKGPLYADGELQTWLAPLLKDAERLGEWQTIKHQWKHRDRLLFSALAAIVLLLLIVVLV